MITGYEGMSWNLFLPKMILLCFFNNANHPSVNTNLHFATRIDDATFKYLGELSGVNTESLEGVPSLDRANTLYFVPTRSNNQTFSTIYQGYFSNNSIEDIQLVSEISKKQAGWVNFDVEVSKDGNFLYFVDGKFDQNGGPYEADIIMAEKNNGTFQRSENQAVLENVNTDALEYTACISSNRLELYFTRVEAPLSNSSLPQIYVATRNSVNEPFNKSYKIEAISGFVEGPTISPDDQTIYFHKKENEKFSLYKIRKE